MVTMLHSEVKSSNFNIESLLKHQVLGFSLAISFQHCSIFTCISCGTDNRPISSPIPQRHNLTPQKKLQLNAAIETKTSLTKVMDNCTIMYTAQILWDFTEG